MSLLSVCVCVYVCVCVCVCVCACVRVYVEERDSVSKRRSLSIDSNGMSSWATNASKCARERERLWFCDLWGMNSWLFWHQQQMERPFYRFQRNGILSNQHFQVRGRVCDSVTYGARIRGYFDISSKRRSLSIDSNRDDVLRHELFEEALECCSQCCDVR